MTGWAFVENPGFAEKFAGTPIVAHRRGKIIIEAPEVVAGMVEDESFAQQMRTRMADDEPAAPHATCR